MKFAFLSFLKIYELTNPKPAFGWFVKASAISIVALMLVAALRTAFSFGLSAFTSLNQFLTGYLDPAVILMISGAEAFAAILGIEGFIVTTGMKSGMNKAESELGSARAIASYILLAVSCVAGLFQSSSMIADAGMMKVIEQVLMYVTGIGVPVAIVFASPYLGLMMNFQNVQIAHWLASAKEAYVGSKERSFARGELVTASRQQNRALPPSGAPQIKFSRTSDRTNVRKTAEVVAWFRESRKLQPSDGFSAAEAANAYYSECATPLNGDVGKLATAIRTYQSRKRGRRGEEKNL